MPLASERELPDDALTVVSQPGFLADFEDEDTLLSEPSIDPSQLSALRDLPIPDGSTTLDGFQRNRQPERLVDEPSKTAQTAQTVSADRLVLSPEYTDQSSMGGPWLSLLLLGVLVAIGIALVVF